MKRENVTLLPRLSSILEEMGDNIKLAGYVCSGIRKGFTVTCKR